MRNIENIEILSLLMPSIPKIYCSKTSLDDESIIWKSLAIKSQIKSQFKSPQLKSQHIRSPQAKSQVTPPSGTTANYLFPHLKTVSEEKLFIQRNKSGAINVIGAGMILCHLNPSNSKMECLIVREKAKQDKWGFPKGKTQYNCTACRRKNCDLHQHCPSCRASEFLCSHHWRCSKCQSYKKTPFCSKHQEPSDAVPVAETRWECAVREVYEETGIDYRQNPHLVFDWFKIGRNYYFMVLTAKYSAQAQPEEISEIKWVTLAELAEQVKSQPDRYNMGIRHVINKYLKS